MRGASSAELDVGLTDDAAPLFHLRRYEGAEFLRRVLPELDVERVQAIDHVTLLEQRVQAAVELSDDLGGRAGGNEDAIPLIGLEIGEGVCNCRQIGERAQPALARMPDRADRAALDVADRRCAVREEEFDLATDQIV